MKIIGLALCALSIATIGTAAQVAVPLELEQHVTMLQGAKAGVDRHENLWFWSPRENVVRRLSPDGNETTSLAPVDSISVDADARLGIVALTNGGTVIEWVTWQGESIRRFALPESAGDVAWLSDSTIAITPIAGRHRIAIWDVATAVLQKTIGPVTSISKGVGRHLGRATLIRVDHPRNRIVTLDAAFGHVYVYNTVGDLLRNTRLVPAMPGIDEWLSTDPDCEDDSKGSTLSVVWHYPTFGIGSDGAVWIVSSLSPTGTVKLVTYRPDGLVRTFRTQVATCPSLRVQPWRGRLVLFRNPGALEPVCTAIIHVPPSTQTDEHENVGELPLPAVHMTPPRMKSRPRIAPNATTDYPCTWCDRPEDPEDWHPCQCPDVPGRVLKGAVCQCQEPICWRICVYEPPL